jgi:peptidoglycan/LPS O-acetylase OafA/YrhL
MKKTIITSAVIFVSFAANAENNAAEPIIDRPFVFDVVNICAVLLVLYVITQFLLRLFKQIFEYRLKHKMVEKQTPADVAEQLLKPGIQNSKSYILQWLFILSGIGIGFTILNFTRPFGLHSLAIMAFSIASGFLGYYLFDKPANNTTIR